MAFKLPDDYPNFKSDITEIADLYEVLCLKNERGRASFREVHRLVAPGDDELEISGIEDENDVFDNEKFDEVCAEIQRREQACGGKYPFSLEERGHSIQLISGIEDLSTLQYTYLLLSTRLNMQDNRVHAGIDGTLLFEKLSAEVAKNYWGERTESMVFGTSVAGNFHAKVDDLCNRIGEGERCKNKNTSPPTEKDGKLDVVVWKSFADGMAAKLIGMGQCKTGSNWEQGLSQLQPDSFCRSWFENMPVVIPTRLFFICDSFPIRQWYSKASSAGIIFDRYRVMDFLPNNLEPTLADETRQWVAAALEFINQ